MYARAAHAATDRVKCVDLLTGREIAAAVRSAKSARAAATRGKRIKDLTNAVDVHMQRHRDRLGADADLENAARIRRGKPPLSPDLLMVRIAIAEVTEMSTSTSLNPAAGWNVVQHAERALLASERALSRPTQLRARGHPERLPDFFER